MALAVNQQIDNATYPTTPGSSSKSMPNPKSKSEPKSMEVLARRLASKLEDRDYRGSVRLPCPDDTLADKTNATYIALKQKHPSQNLDSSIPPAPAQ